MNSPHCAQYVAVHGETPPMGSFTRILSNDAPRERYRRRKGEMKSVLHWGQRKLLLCEMEFLTNAMKDFRDGEGDWTVIYAGAAPGKHIPYLASLFPEVDFHLYDPNPFAFREHQHDLPSPSIHVYNEYFTDLIAQEWGTRVTKMKGVKKVLFICDIRTFGSSDSQDLETMESENVEEYIAQDMHNQMVWHRQIGPLRSILKFRLPWGGGKTTYLDGKVYLPVFGGQTTTEARLVVDGVAGVAEAMVDQVEWDNEKYEEQMFYFNTHTRVFLYGHDVKADGLDFCYDCRAEVCILSEYAKLRKEEKEEGCEDELSVSTLSEEISAVLSDSYSKNPRTLAMPQPAPGHRGKLGELSGDLLRCGLPSLSRRHKY